MVTGRHLTAFLTVLFVILPVVASPAHTLEAPATATTTDLVPTPEGKEYGDQRKEIEELLKSIESQWNAHNLEGVMSYYAEDYVNNDGLDKKAVSALTQDFWKTYPDAKSTSETKQVRIEGPFATIESRDTAYGTTAKEMPGIGTKGELQSVSEGQLYIKRLGPAWKIIGDRIDYEKVRVAFGLAKQVNALFSAPEQVKAGHQYCAKLEVTLPPGLTAVGSITSQPLEYPQPQPTDAWRPLESSAATLERVLGANSKNRNELLMATVGITNPSRNSLMGIAFLTRRLNVIPTMEDGKPATTSAANSVKDHITDKSK
ncbi:MAG: nuclear transport factor 2 family protein [Candidatus Melainabacteria bacterium]|nr:nuclear transport factor 2 family protein [Candidatus Melainabacteria bacterium]